MELSQKIMPYAVRLLSRRRYAVAELKKKLLEKFGSDGMTAEVSGGIDKTLARLVELKYLNDDEFIELFIRDQLLRKAQGFRLIENKLRQKGIGRDLIQKHLSSQKGGEDELGQAVRAAKKKLLSLNRKKADLTEKEERLKQKEKIFRFLASRGFSQGTCMKALKEIGRR